ncbi:unnamed protein product [Phytophthora fragariaefolia]|uniref:Unnamed protein product n=1 Tax=Phytophthora fragariaefolia TaxID=1490495 RepID=A0A9W7CUJ2_9STRA|nr:unnamed protein product [Phytophthora fragariaefolia]
MSRTDSKRLRENVKLDRNVIPTVTKSVELTKPIRRQRQNERQVESTKRLYVISKMTKRMKRLAKTDVHAVGPFAGAMHSQTTKISEFPC